MSTISNLAFRYSHSQVRIHEVTAVVLSKLVTKFDFLAAIFYDQDQDPTIQGLESVAVECQKEGIAVVKIR